MIHVDSVRTPWFTSAWLTEGNAVRIATEAKLPVAIRDNPETLAAFRFFVWFAGSWIAAAPGKANVFGDLRYGVTLAGIESMWGIALTRGTDAPVVFERNTDKMRVGTIWDTIVGR